jgi:rhodanese-related sulfurtransferase
MEVADLRKIQEEVFIFDTRKKAEYLVSHLPNARFLAYPKIDTSALQGVLPTDTLVVYCSVGYRSERIGEELRSRGFQHVFNLYGSIFEWANRGYPIVDQHGLPTRKIHTFNRRWSKWVDSQELELVW